MKEIRVGMIGAGAIANSHCKGINRHPKAKVTAIADPNSKRANELKDLFDIETVYSDWKEIVSDENIDAVAIALPNFLHAPVSIAALEAGKHVILDKPFALNLEEAEAVVAAAEKSGKIFMVGMNQRFSKEGQTIKAIIDRGELGEIYRAETCWMRRAGAPKFGTWFGRKDLAGGGCLLDIGVHELDLCLHLINNWEPVSVTGQVFTKFGNRGIGEGGWGKSIPGEHVFDVDDSATALIKFANGAVVDLKVSWIQHQATGNQNGVKIFGTEGGAQTHPIPKVFRFAKEDGEYEVVEPQNVKLPYGDNCRHTNWIDSILGEAEPICKLSEALIVQKILDAIYESSATGEQVKIK